MQDLKKKKYFDSKEIQYKDFSCYSAEVVDYTDFAHKIVEAINNGDFEIGIAFCGSGQGISITTNKYQNVYTALCWNVEIAKLFKEHNNANICAIPGRFVSDEDAIAIVKAYLSASFEGGRHLRRIKKISL